MRTTATVGSAEDWRDAIRQAATLLARAGVVPESYGEQCIRCAEELGPYFVLSPGVALSHARPDGSCSMPGLSLLRLDVPVEFGHQDNDPVDLVFCLASPDSQAHLGALRLFAVALSHGLDQRLRSAGGEDLEGVLREAAT